MKGDLTRATFRPERHFASVRMQQGRVLLDADWNEQADIDAHRRHVTAGDLIGPSGGPLHAAAFAVRLAASLSSGETNDLTARGIIAPYTGDVLLGPGRYYVDGILVENEQIVSLRHQPDVPGTGPALATGRHLVYLHVWERHLTWLDDPLLREVALNGPDTATRSRVVWQIGSVPVASGTSCLAAVPDYETLIAPSTGTLRARAAAGSSQQGPCVVSADAGYTRLENQLYRVEVHRGGAVGTATFKWSRDNGAVVTSVQAVNGQDVTVGEVGRDALLSFAPGQFVEALDDADELAGTPGDMFEIVSVDASTGVIRLNAAPTLDLALHPKLRRWDGGAAANITTSAWIPLGQDGVEIRFSSGATYRAGDYWTIPARTTTGDVEWPEDGTGDPIARPPAGIVHHWARLAMVDVNGAGVVTAFSDCRNLFPPVTELTDFEYLGGDGQEVMPNLTQAQVGTRVALPSPLRVGVSNGRWPVVGARVFWEVLDGDGRVQGSAAAGTTAESFTQSDGTATCTWSLLPTSGVNRVRATLRDVANNPVGLPIVFGANVSVASQVAYDPRTVCGGTAPPVTTVQAALDRQMQLLRLFYAGGDGQEALPAATLPQPLRVSVANACGAVQGATVTFNVESGGRVAATSAGVPAGNTTVSINTDANGIAEAFWRPADDAARRSQQANAVLASAPPGSNLPLGSPTTVRFNARVLVAGDVGYAPSSNCNLPASVNTVQAALDQICSGLGAPTQRVVVTDVRMAAMQVRHDAVIPPYVLSTSGFDILCDQSIFVSSSRAARLTVYLPPPQSFYGYASDSGYVPFDVNANVFTNGTTLRWRAVDPGAVAFLNGLYGQFNWRYIPARLTVYGNLVRSSADQSVYLDGDLFAGPPLGTQFPTGNGVRGGSLEIFFWLAPIWGFSLGAGELTAAGTTLGTITLDRPAPEGGLSLALASEDPEALSLPETIVIPEGETTFQFEARVAPPRSGTRELVVSSTVSGVSSPVGTLSQGFTLGREATTTTSRRTRRQ
ncbi:MAG TPA: DUF6519 domain-containing protein [Longimicrobium sp.]